MGLKMRLVMMALGSLIPSFFLVVAPKAALAETQEVPTDKSIVATGITVLSLVAEQAQNPDPDAPPVFRYERDPRYADALGDRPIPHRSAESLLVDGAPLEPESTDTSLTESTTPEAAKTEHESDESTDVQSDPVAEEAAEQGSAPSDPMAEEETGAEESTEAGSEPVAEDVTEEGNEPVAEETLEEPSEEGSEEVSEEYRQWQQLLMEGDRLFLAGRYPEAEQRYRQAKNPDGDHSEPVERPDAFADPELLSPAGRVYWREYQAGIESGMETRIHVPLELLTQQYPEFIPAQIEYALYLSESGDEEASEDALELLERAVVMFPENADLADARVDFLAEDEQWLQAAIAARQFAVLNPDDPQVAEFEEDAETYQRRFRSRLRGRLTRNAIGNAVTGALGFALTGNLFGPFSAIETTVLMLRGESSVGDAIADRAIEELDLIEDEKVVAYVNTIGHQLADLAGRDEFEYEFYVVEDEELNAFALPGGKVFINAGAILSTETEAELAGLIAHELAHAVLSHGFQLVTGGNLTANVLQFVPYGGYAANLAVLRYSRGMERQADRLGTQLLANSNYAADGMYRLMVTLHEESDRRSRFDWLSSHPDTPERIRNLDRLIDEGGYNRYAFEGIERHLRIRERVEQLLREAGKLDSEDDITIQEP